MENLVYSHRIFEVREILPPGNYIRGKGGLVFSSI